VGLAAERGHSHHFAGDVIVVFLRGPVRSPDIEGRAIVSATDDRSGRNQDRPDSKEEIPNPETGVGIGARTDPDTFEPEEDPD